MPRYIGYKSSHCLDFVTETGRPETCATKALLVVRAVLWPRIQSMATGFVAMTHEHVPMWLWTMHYQMKRVHTNTKQNSVKLNRAFLSETLENGGKMRHGIEKHRCTRAEKKKNSHEAWLYQLRHFKELYTILTLTFQTLHCDIWKSLAYYIQR